MTTETTQEPQPPVMNVAEVYRILGSLERGQAEIKEQLVRNEERTEQRFDRIEQRIDRNEERTEQRIDRNEERADRHEERNEQRYRETNRRIDRLWYTIAGATIVILAGLAGLAAQNALMG